MKQKILDSDSIHELKAVFKVNNEWDDMLEDENSEIYKNLSKEIKTGLQQIISQNNNVKEELDIRSIELRFR